MTLLWFAGLFMFCMAWAVLGLMLGKAIGRDSRKETERRLCEVWDVLTDQTDTDWYSEPWAQRARAEVERIRS